MQVSLEHGSMEQQKGLGRWQKEEHQRFLQALIQFGKDWKQVEEYVGTRTGPQVRSHSQKFFLKLSKISKDRRKYKNRENIERTETQIEIMQLFKEEDITMHTPSDMAAIIKNQYISMTPHRKNKTQTQIKQKIENQDHLALEANHNQQKKTEELFVVREEYLTRKKAQNKLMKVLEKINQEENVEEDSYLMTFMKKNKDYFLSGKEIMGLIDIPKHSIDGEDEETESKRKTSFALVDENQDTKNDVKKRMFQKMQ